MSIPFTRSLPYVLREQLHEGEQVKLLIARAVSVPNTSHVVVELGGVNITVPRLASYTAPSAGDSVYLLSSTLVMIALGTIK
jgi:hypothetical protein